jgi:UPF0042 nucleotide-binding protein
MTRPLPRLILVTGQSGSGKSVALAALEDSGFYCIDNLPPDLLDHLAESYLEGGIVARGIAISIDARAPSNRWPTFPTESTDSRSACHNCRSAACSSRPTVNA